VEQVQPLTTYLAEAQANMPDHAPWSEQATAVQRQLLRECRKAARGETAVSLPDLLRDLQTLKADYITAYAAAHRHSVLGPDEDAQRREMMTGERWQALKALVAIDLLAANKPEMDGWGQAISNLRACTAFHEGLLAESPTCTCRFRPREASSRPAAEVLDGLDERLTNLVLRWQQALRDGLNSASAQNSLHALSPAEKQPITQFLAQPDDDPAIPSGLVAAANQVLRGIHTLPLLADDLLEALRTGGMPCTVSDLQQRFNRYIAQTMRGHDTANTRLTLE
jgi:hypothetical protein